MAGLPTLYLLDTNVVGPDNALRAVRLLTPRKVLPIHYDTWPPIAQDARGWAERVARETQAKAVVLRPGESVEV